MNVFLIDADNLNAGAWIDEAFRMLEESEGTMPVRRAYGSAENLKSLAEVLRVWSVRPFVNLSLTKNTTDIALAVDAMEFACQTPKPRMVVIGSGDADFVPLVVRLRERGIRTVCVSERGKMGREAVSAYDRVILVGQEQALYEAQLLAAPTLEAPVASAVASKKTVKKSPAVKAPAKKAATKTTAAKKAPASKKAVKKTASVVAERAADKTRHVDVLAILQAVPALQTGQPQHISAVAKALHDANLLGKNSASTKLFKKFPNDFEMRPTEKPHTVQYILPPDQS
ncbi:NYN domain-containing protein [Rhodoferax sp.]|uniref:NYN domain-containing protein n=1 Tax=Rhodoferax sp. TaxID=50421 RepID=UPI002715F2D5|nr:NYN domain-containing protein [Rhodoferax sp.]MDO9196561.1 NYN domain-containing protein [Rhodoferax sp.]